MDVIFFLIYLTCERFLQYFFFLVTFIDISVYANIPMAKQWIGTNGKNQPNPFLEGFGLNAFTIWCSRFGPRTQHKSYFAFVCEREKQKKDFKEN